MVMLWSAELMVELMTLRAVHVMFLEPVSLPTEYLCPSAVMFNVQSVQLTFGVGYPEAVQTSSPPTRTLLDDDRPWMAIS